MEWALKEWNKRKDTDKRWAKCKTYFSTEYVNCRNHAAIKAKQIPFSRASNQAQEEPQEQEDNDIDMAAVTHQIGQ